MARLFLAEAVRVRRARRTWPTVEEYQHDPAHTVIVPGVTTEPAGWYVTAGHNLGPTYRGTPTFSTVQPEWDQSLDPPWSVDRMVPDFDDDGIDWAAAEVVSLDTGLTVAYGIFTAQLDAAPDGTLDLGDPSTPAGRAAMRADELSNPNTRTLRTMTGRKAKDLPLGQTRMWLAKRVFKQVGWCAVKDGLTCEIDP